MLRKYNLAVGTFLMFLPLASAGAGEHVDAPQWTLVRQLTPMELAECESLLLQGTSPEPFYVPRPEDFRLERLSPEPTWEVMTFGWADEGYPTFDFPEGAKTTRVNLHLRRSDRRERLLRMMQELGSNGNFYPVDLYAESALPKGVRYRLTWSFRPVGSKKLQTRRCEFQIGKPPAEKPPSARGPAKAIANAYLAEILFRDGDGILFLAQSILPRPRNDDHTVAAIGFTAGGESVSPPDPGYVSKQPISKVVVAKPFKPKPPPAERIRLYGVSADAPPGQVSVHVSDVGTRGPLPTEPGDPTFVLLGSGHLQAIFRFELLTTNVTCLRQDADYWRRRTGEIAKEVIARRTWIGENSHRLATVVSVLQDTVVINDLRVKLQTWIDQGEGEIKQTGFPHEMVDALITAGTAQDVGLLDQIAERPRQASYLRWKVARLARRVGLVPTRSLLFTLLENSETVAENTRLKSLRRLDPSIPERVCGDGMLLGLTREFQLDPAEFVFLGV